MNNICQIICVEKIIRAISVNYSILQKDDQT